MLVALTGAGISKASGISTFEECPELRTTLDRDVWNEAPEEVWQGIWQMYGAVNAAEPNAAHKALAEAGVPIVTQNIDGLHQRAGSERVIELHGNLSLARCTVCGRTQPLAACVDELFPCCQCQGLLRPDVVLYKEQIRDWWSAYELMTETTVLLVVGTSLTVNPAAVLPEIAERSGAEVILINHNAEQEVPRLL